jgi:hypothetical protein
MLGVVKSGHSLLEMQKRPVSKMSDLLDLFYGRKCDYTVVGALDGRSICRLSDYHAVKKYLSGAVPAIYIVTVYRNKTDVGRYRVFID